MNIPLLNLEIRLELDIVLARQRARQIAALLGFAPLDQTRIATATSEIARNTVQYAGGGRIDFIVESGSAPALVIRIRERGSGIKDLQAILEGQYVSSTGLGLGIKGAQRLMDRFTIESMPGAGATILLAKDLPHRSGAITVQELGRISAELARQRPGDSWTSSSSRTRNCSTPSRSCGTVRLKSLRCTVASSTRPTGAFWPSMPSSTTTPRPSNVSPI